MVKRQTSDKEEPAAAPAPGTPALPPDAGLVQGGDRDVSERPQGDPEVPELGAHDDQRPGSTSPGDADVPDVPGAPHGS